MNVAELPTLFAPLPQRISRLYELAYNLWWSWHPEAQALYAAIDGTLWERSGHNPVKFIREVSLASLEAKAADPVFLAQYDKVLIEFDIYMRDEQTWLARAENLVEQVRRLRELELGRHRRSAWRLWATAVVLALAATVACGAGYVWAARPYEAELASLQQRVELLDFVAQRVILMTPAERQEFDRLMKWRGSAK